MQNMQNEVAQLLMQSVRDEHEQYQALISARLDAADAFGNLCVRPLADSFVRPLLTSLGFLDDFCNAMASVQMWQEQVLKFDALFVAGSQTRRLRQSIVEYCGVSNLRVVADIVRQLEWSAAAQPVFRFCDLLVNVQAAGVPSAAEPIPDFFQRVFPSYLSSMMD